MTVKELIEKLQAFDPDLRVVTSGLDGYGYYDVGMDMDVEVVHIIEDPVEFTCTYREATPNDDPSKIIKAVNVDY